MVLLPRLIGQSIDELTPIYFHYILIYVTIVNHLFPIFINDHSKILILGSFPSVKSREDGFYYSHPRNRFFLVLSNIFNEECPISIDDRKEFLKKHKIALYDDVIEECEIHASSDSSIRNVKPIDIESILRKYPNIECIGITGGKAKELFDRYLSDKVDVKVKYLPSTSSANARMKVDDLVKEYRKLFD